MKTHDPLNESLSEVEDPITKRPPEVMVINLEVPPGVDLVLTVNGVRVELD